MSDLDNRSVRWDVEKLGFLGGRRADVEAFIDLVDLVPDDRETVHDALVGVQHLMRQLDVRLAGDSQRLPTPDCVYSRDLTAVSRPVYNQWAWGRP
ncbi:hypothetical protein OHS18_27205 [Amycolatopsis sp. NBC_00355]|uniref:hypothetical protein n=1 Tax=Amycolatopsis sp. NBC_00355 TaxID=2975957 RepID=UPI002E269725